LCNRGTEGIGLHVVGETPPSPDLDDREPLAILGLECLVAGDVHLPQVEAELGLKRPYLLESPVAEVAALRVVDDDVGGYG
jgi:hypothetical protein